LGWGTDCNSIAIESAPAGDLLRWVI